jgi:hypothetical protein
VSTNRSRAFAAVAILAALAGCYFLGFSTVDFVQYLDRQAAHAVHCTFAPTSANGSVLSSEAAGCRAALFSAYSSLFRTHVWGGIPVALFGLGTYAFFAAFGLSLLFSRKVDTRASKFFAFASLMPVLASVIFGTISATRVGALCKLCAGTYISSGVLAISAFLLHFSVKGEEDDGRETIDAKPYRPLLWAAELLIFLLLPAGAYAAQVPDYTSYVTSCQGLAKPDDPKHVLLDIPTGASAGVPATMVLDPLCPSCKALDERLQASDALSKLNLRAVVFPLDSDCNWMLSEPMHPGACVVARALLCAGANAGQVLDYSYAHQAELTQNPDQIFSVYPDLKACADSPETKQRLDLNLRFAVDNQLPVMTPQLFLGDHAVCDEDTDLGLDYALTKLGVGL